MPCNAMLRGANVTPAVSRVTRARVTVTNAPGLVVVVSVARNVVILPSLLLSTQKPFNCLSWPGCNAELGMKCNKEKRLIIIKAGGWLKMLPMMI